MQKKWETAEVLDYDPFSPDLNVFERRAPFWLCPISKNQGGYDFIHVTFIREQHNKLIFKFEFVQTTKSDKHDLKLQYFQQCLSNIRDIGILNKISIKEIDILMLVPKGKGKNFKVSRLEGSLADAGWHKSKLIIAEIDVLPQYW
jgi:hypothetical protein